MKVTINNTEYELKYNFSAFCIYEELLNNELKPLFYEYKGDEKKIAMCDVTARVVASIGANDADILKNSLVSFRMVGDYIFKDKETKNQVCEWLRNAMNEFDLIVGKQETVKSDATALAYHIGDFCANQYGKAPRVLIRRLSVLQSILFELK
ncbi:hypothetical protein Barb4_05015 [Bacteroidales bacterium Barb4]|nr:hypothetical protein Barb4_05015 [Bacteroidales bacterium Barb4]